MRFAKIKLVAVLAVAATVIAFSTTAAFATDYTVSGTSADTLTNSGNLVFTDTIGGAQITCSRFSSPGAAIVGNHTFAPGTPPGAPPGTGGTIDSALDVYATSGSLTGCVNPTIGAATIGIVNTWKLGVVSKTTFNGASGYLTFVRLQVVAASCSFEAKGYLPGAYTNSTGNFVTSAGAGLILSNVTGGACALVHVVNGHTAKLAGTIHIAPSPTIS